MTDDLLRKATVALREETPGDDDSARFTRTRVMTSLHTSELRRRTRIAFLLPVAACFVVATAWGTVNGKTQALIAQVSEALGFESKPPAPSAPKPNWAPRTAPQPTSAPVAPAAQTAPPPKPEQALAVTEVKSEPAPTPSSSTAKPRVASGRTGPARGLSNTQATQTAPPSLSNTSPPVPLGKPDISDRAHELYRAAHQRHFVEHADSEALSAWDAYLAEAPGGRFALEARYNRALCLVRLRRGAEARMALTPFAAGQFGGYRLREAQALLDALP